MSGRVEQTTMGIVAMLCAGVALAGPGRFAPPQPEARDIRLDGADARQRWSVVASATRTPWDPFELAFAPRELKAVAHGDRAAGRLALDWTGLAPTGQWRASAFAGASELRLDRIATSGDGLDERLERTQRASRFGGSIGFASGAWDATVRVGHQDLELREGLRNGASGARPAFARDGAALTHLSARLGSELGLPLGTLRAAVEPLALRLATEDSRHAGGHDAVGLVARSFDWRLPLAAGWRAGAAMAHGPATSEHLLPLRDPLQGGFVPVVDPALQAKHRELSLAWRGAWSELDASAFRTTMPAALSFHEGGWRLVPRPVERQGVRLAWRHDVSRFLTLDAQGTFGRARFADGAREGVPGAPGAFGTAGAMLRVPKGWSAWLFVSMLGPRDAAGEDLPRIRSTTRVNAQVQHKLSRHTRVSFDVFNVFDHRVREVDAFSASRAAPPAGMGETFLFRPTDARGFLLRVRTSF